MTLSLRLARRLWRCAKAIDVVEIAEPRFLAVDTMQYRPLQGGSQIQTTSGTGTLGAILYDRLDHRPVLLTNNHVLTTPGSPMLLPSDTRVWQPAGGPVVGNIKRIVPMFSAPLGESGYKFAPLVDAGIVGPDSSVVLDFSVVELGRHPYVVLPPFEGLQVERCPHCRDWHPLTGNPTAEHEYVRAPANTNGQGSTERD